MQTVVNIIIGENVTFLAAAVALSLFSIVRGHINYISAAKRGYLPFKGKILLLLYFALSALVRVYAVVVFFAPLLGTFGTLKLGRTATVSASNDTVYDIFPNGTVITLGQEWERNFQLQRADQLLPEGLLATTYAIIIPTLLVVHLLAGIIIKMLFKGTDTFWQILYTFVCPPLFTDWEEIYRKHVSTLSISDSWKRSVWAFLSYVGLFIAENLALCTPIILLNAGISLITSSY